MEPLVSIVCDVYNHEPYLRDCLEGFVSQQVDFPFEILIHDDASKDRSADIIREYAEKYPALFRPIYQTENKYSTGISLWGAIQFPRVKGKYIALCEGDDFWTDPNKLQKEVEILEKDPSLMAVVTNAKVVDQHGATILARKDDIVPGNKEGRYDLHSYFSKGHHYQTANVLFRSTHLEEIIQKINHTRNKYLGDWTLWAILHSYGDFYYLDQVTSAYRINPTSLTHTYDRIGRAKAHLPICKALKEVLPKEYSRYLEEGGWMHFAIFKAYYQERKYLHATAELISCLIRYPKFTIEKIIEAIRYKNAHSN